MSNSLAKKRRVNLPTPPSPSSPSTLPSSSSSPSSLSNQPPRPMMTLPQILSILEKRLSVLEKSREEGETTMVPTVTNAVMDDSLKETLDEYESRFEMLAEQINHIKDTLMKLQTFTMEVNKTLMEDKFQIVREQQPENNSIHFSEKEDDEEA